MSNTKTVKGVLGVKLGMTQVWDENNKLVPVTAVEIAPNVVTQLRTTEVDGYSAVQIASGQIDPRKVTKPLQGHFEKAGVTPRRHLTEFRTEDTSEYSLGQEIAVDIFEPGSKVDVVGTSKGKGFQGVMKRHGFKGGRATHGSMFHRAPGSIGGSSFPSRVYPGMKGTGRMGGKRITTKNLLVVKVDEEKNLIYLRGSVPGGENGYVALKRAKRG